MDRLLYAGLAGSLVSLGGILSAYHLVFDLLAHFRIQYIVLIVGVLGVALGLRRYRIALALLCCLLVHVVDVARSQFPTASAAGVSGPTIRVMSSNLLASNTQYEEYARYIEAVGPDVIVLQEYTSAWANALSSSLGEYEHKVSLPIESHTGIALFSKLPFKNSSSLALANTHRPSVEAVVVIANSTLRIIGTHPPPPISQPFYRERNQQLQALANVTRTQLTPLLVLGDLNITPWSAHFRQLLKHGKLHDGRRGFGILPTWPSGFFALQIPIDHVLINHGVHVMQVHTSEGLSSDHRSIWADIQLR